MTNALRSLAKLVAAIAIGHGVLVAGGLPNARGQCST